MKKLFHKKKAPVTDQTPPPIPADRKPAAKVKKEKREFSYLLEFRCRGQLFADLETNSVNNGVFKIGKAPESDLVLPGTDRICGEEHLELHFSNKGLRLQAKPGIHFYFNGKKVTVCHLKMHDRVAFGDCELNIKASRRREESFSKYHRLEFLTGEKKGKMIPLNKDLIRIGSAPDNDIVLTEDVISRYHARIKIAENGECWLKDLESINGTTVNEVKLGPQERLLMDSDELSFASTSLLFLDKNVPHTRSQIGQKIMIMGGTLVVVALILALLYSITPHSSQLLLAAEYYAAKENFDTSQKMLEKMPYAKAYQSFKEQYQQFKETLERYRETHRNWSDFQKNLQDGKWQRALEIYGRLEENNRADWDWDKSTTTRKLELLAYAKKLLNLHFELQNLLHATELSPEQKIAREKDLQKIKLPPLKEEAEWLLPLRKEIAGQKQKLLDSIRIWHQAESLLARLGSQDCDMAALEQELEKLHSLAVGSVKTRIFDLLDTLQLLVENDRVIRKNRDAIVDLQFADVTKSISFVSRDECLIHPEFIRTRDRLIASHRKQLVIAGNMTLQQQHLRRLGVHQGKFPAVANEFLTEKKLREVLEISPVPYERFFGKTYFYQIMAQSALLQENIYSADLPPGISTLPLCLTLNSIFKAAEASHLYLQTLPRESLYRGRIAAFDKECIKILAQRQKLLDFFRKAARENQGNRKYFIAQTAVFYFSTAGSIKGDDMKIYAENWKRYRARMQGIMDAYNPFDKAQLLQLAREVQATGLPGEPAMNLLWSIK